MTLDYITLGFALTATDVASILGKTEPEVHDLARAGMLPFLVKRDTPSAPPRMWFHPDEVRQVEVLLRESVTRGGGLAVDDRNRLRVAAALRAYLDAVPAERAYDVALLKNAPLLGRTRKRSEVTHVRAEAVAAFGSTLDNVPVPVSLMAKGLEFFGAVRMHGVTALAEPGKQRWGIWYRLPPGFSPGDDDEPEVIEGLMEGALEEGDRVTRRGSGPATIVEPLATLDDSVD